MSGAWSETEVDLTIDAYFSMLRLELDGNPYVKSAMRKELGKQVDRSEGSLEFKFQNISAALMNIGALYVNGYKPRQNMQTLLRDKVETAFANDPELRRSMLHAVQAPPPTSATVGPETAAPQVPFPGSASEIRRRVGCFVDFQAVEAANRSLGAAGEVAVVEFERRRLWLAGKRNLSERVRHVSAEDGDGLGFDILSFDEGTGRELYLEVKTTRATRDLPFLVSRNEVEFSEEEPEGFRVFRLFEFGASRAGFYVLSGSLHSSAQLRPESYQGLPSSSATSA